MYTLKAKLADPTCIINIQINVIPSPVVTQAIAASGADAVVIDMEHGAIGHSQAHAMIAATQGFDCAPLVRVAEMGDATVKRVLDLGAEGIVFPLIRTADDARAAVASTRYPPHGNRGWGPFIAHSRWDVGLMDYQSRLGDGTVVCLLLETPEAVENIDEICAVPGVDLLVVAQFDLSTTMGISGQFAHPDYLAAEKHLEAAAFKAGVPLIGNAPNEARAKELFARGYRGIGGFDILSLKAAVATTVAWCKN